MNYIRENYFYGIEYDIIQEVNESFMMAVFKIFDIYYPNFSIHDYDELNPNFKDWNEYILTHKVPINDNTSIDLVIPFYYTEYFENIKTIIYKKENYQVLFEKPCSLFFYTDDDNKITFMIEFYSLVFSPYVIPFGYNPQLIDQSHSANLNRKILSKFLKHMESLLKPSGMNVSSHYLDKSQYSIYGISDEIFKVFS